MNNLFHLENTNDLCKIKEQFNKTTKQFHF